MTDIYITTASRQHSPVFNKILEMQQGLLAEQREREEKQQENRKEIYKIICERTNTTQ